MHPELGEVTEEEGDAIDVRAAVAEQRRRRRRRRQMARRAAEASPSSTALLRSVRRGQQMRVIGRGLYVESLTAGTHEVHGSRQGKFLLITHCTWEGLLYFAKKRSPN